MAAEVVARPNATEVWRTSIAGPLGGIDGDSGASTTYVGDVDDGSLGRR
jgi:hypothetical protein